MNKTHFLNVIGNDVFSLPRRSFLIKGALVPLLPMAAMLPGAMSMNAVASSGVTTLLILNNGTRFNGLGQDRLLEMQHLGNGYRIYNPMLKRFHAMDSLAPFNEGGVHSYAYVSNDPVNQIDPTGHMGIMAIIGIIGLALFVVGTALTVTSNAVANNHRSHAESIKPDWTWGYDWSEYDSSMQAADNWGVGSTVGKVIGAIGGVMMLAAGGSVATSGAKSATKGIKKGIDKTSDMFKKKQKINRKDPHRRGRKNRQNRQQPLGGSSNVPHPGGPNSSPSSQVVGLL